MVSEVTIGLNCTFMELKDIYEFKNKMDFRWLNCTFMELKDLCRSITSAPLHRLNCTFMELKVQMKPRDNDSF